MSHILENKESSPLQSPFFSIIMPAYNSGKTVQNCIESIICQTFKEFELLIIDALSSDETLSIARRYADERIKILSEKDDGIYDAMNKGIQLSVGQWIYFIGSDDSFYNENVLSDIHKFLSTKNIDVVYGNIVSSIFEGKYDGVFDYAKIFKKNISHQAIFFKRSLFEQTGYFNLKYKFLADYDHNLKWFLNKKYRVEYLDTIIADYGSDGCSTTLNRTDRFNKDRNYNYILYGFRSLPKFYMLKFCGRELFNNKMTFKRKLIICFICFIVLFRIK